MTRQGSVSMFEHNYEDFFVFAIVSFLCVTSSLFVAKVVHANRVLSSFSCFYWRGTVTRPLTNGAVELARRGT